MHSSDLASPSKMSLDEERRPNSGHSELESEQEDERPRQLPADLPRTLDDRQNFTTYNQETEYYDAWQGKVQTFVRWRPGRVG